jgi:hypothetical protein
MMGVSALILVVSAYSLLQRMVHVLSGGEATLECHAHVK